MVEGGIRKDDRDVMSKKVYLLWFIPADADEDNGLLIGVYDTEVSAKAAIDRLRSKPGFADYPEGFQVHEREMGRDGWTDGFVRD